LVLAADRAQSDNPISSREVQKIHKLGDTVVAFAGRVGIIEKSIKLIEDHLASGPFDITKIESGLMAMLGYYKTKNTDISLDGLIIVKENGSFVAYRVEGDGLCYQTSATPYASMGAGVLQANPLLDQRLKTSGVMPVDRTVTVVYSVIQDVARFNPSVEGPPTIYTFRGVECSELDPIALGVTKQEVEYQNNLAAMFHSVLNENDATKIGKLTDLLVEGTKKKEAPPVQSTDAGTTQVAAATAQSSTGFPGNERVQAS
jgi:20S proteasome alpha/beta subunit